MKTKSLSQNLLDIPQDFIQNVLQMSLPLAILRIDANNRHNILWHNEKFLEMLAYTKEYSLSQTFNTFDCFDLNERIQADKIIQNFRHTGDNSVLEMKVYTRTKEEKIWAVSLYYVDKKDSVDHISSIYCFCMDISAQKMKDSSHVIEKDPLTDVLSRAETKNQIQDFIQKNPHGHGCFFMIDTDDFKTINDTKGHIVGDLVLTEMAKGMKHIMRIDDIVGRIGGDEFIIFMKNATEVDARKKAHDLIEMFQKLFSHEKNTISVSCSIGVSLYPENGNNFKELYTASDKALYQVKRQGKNNYMLYDEISLDQKISNYISTRTETKTDTMDNNMAIMNYVFITLFSTDSLDKSIKEILNMIGERFDVSRAYIFENSEDNLTTSNTYEWCNIGISPEIDELQNVSFKEHGNYEQLFADDPIFYCRDIHSLPPKQKNILSQQGICSTLQCAIYEDDTFIGFIGFDECTGLRIWTQEEIDLLTMMSQLISLFLQKKKAKIIKKQSNNYQNILQYLDECIFVTENESNILLYANKAFYKRFPDHILGEVCMIKPASCIPILWDAKESSLYHIP